MNLQKIICLAVIHDDFVTCIKILENNFFQNIKTLMVQKGVVANLIEIFSHVPFVHLCLNFSKEYLTFLLEFVFFLL